MKRQWCLLGCLVLSLAVLGSNSQANEIYQFDLPHSSISFSVHQFLGNTLGKFINFKGTIELDRDHPEQSSVIAKIDVRSIDTGNAKRDDHLRSSDFFNVAKYPEITFKSRTVKQIADKSGDVAGDLTMHGVTKSITLHVRLVGPASAEADRSQWTVTTEPLRRRDFGLMFGGAAEAVSGISQNVAVKIEIQATRTQ
jgi:polyisoprenoid-binding protein YceI